MAEIDKSAQEIEGESTANAAGVAEGDADQASGPDDVEVFDLDDIEVMESKVFG